MTLGQRNSSSMHRPEDVYPDQADEILRRRASDPEFDGICRDYELLASNQATAGNAASGRGVAPDPDVEASLADLSREIKDLLRRKSPETS